jgi:hypothetical protein
MAHVPIPHPSLDELAKTYTIDGKAYPGGETVLYYAPGKIRPISVPAYYYAEYVRLYTEALLQETKTKVGEFVQAVRDNEHHILAITYREADVKIVPTYADTSVTQQECDNASSHSRYYINRTDFPLYVTDEQNVVLHCPATAQAGNMDFVIRDTWVFQTLDHANKSLAAMREMPASIRTPVHQTLIRSLSEIVHPNSTKGRLGKYTIVVDRYHTKASLQHGLSVYDPTTRCTICKEPPVFTDTPLPDAPEATCRNLHAALQCAQGEKSVDVVRVRLNGVAPRNYYYRALGQVRVITSSATEVQRPAVTDGTEQSELLTDYVEIYANATSIVRRSGEGWIEPASTEHDTMVLWYRVSLQQASELFGLYDSPALAHAHGDPAQHEHEQLRVQLARQAALRSQAEADVAALKIEQAKTSGMLSQREHEQRMAALVESHAQEIKTLTEKRENSQVEHAQTIEAKKTSHAHDMTTEARRSEGEGYKYAAVVVGSAVTIGVAAAKVIPLLVDSLAIFGLFAHPGAAVVAGGIGVAGFIASGSSRIVSVAKAAVNYVGDTISSCCSGLGRLIFG